MKKPLLWIAILLTVLFGLWFFQAPLLEGAAQWLIVQDKLAKADAMIVLAGDNNGERVSQAVELYRQGYAPKLLLSGGPLAWQLSSAEWMKKQALTMGVPESAIIMEGQSRSTLENAEFTLPIVKEQRWESIILITSPTHTRRADRVFKKLFDQAHIDVITCPVQKSEFNPKDWWRRHEDTQAVISEYVSLIYYLLKGF